jgi:hypothetical protein
VQAIAETIFDSLYLAAATYMGVRLVHNGEPRSEYRLMGWMAIVLAFGDSFHLISRVYALWTTGIEANAAALGVGKLITSITMTFFYLMLYAVWKRRYRQGNTRTLDVTLYVLAAVRIALSLFPQNAWLSADPPVAWGVYRNIPFLIMGIVILVLFFRSTRGRPGDGYRWMWLAITLSFAFYVPVVLFASAYPLVGILMIPKTLAYVWIVWMGYRERFRSLNG